MFLCEVVLLIGLCDLLSREASVQCVSFVIEYRIISYLSRTILEPIASKFQFKPRLWLNLECAAKIRILRLVGPY